MAILLDFFDNVILQAITEEIVPKRGFFKDRYFPTGAGDIFKADEVLTEYRKGDRKLAAFVAPDVHDIPIARRGYEVHSYQPAYIAPSRVLTMDELKKRGFGEALYPGMDEAQRAARLLADDMNDMENRIAGTEEWMAAQTMISNGCTMQEMIDGKTKGDKKIVRFYDNKASVIPSKIMFVLISAIADLLQLSEHHLLKHRRGDSFQLFLGDSQHVPALDPAAAYGTVTELDIRGVLDRIGHGENAGENSENRVLVQMVLILGHLLADVAHEVNTAGDVIGEVPLSPSLRTADDNDTLLEGLSGGCGDVGLAVVVHGVAVNQTAHSQTSIRGTVLGGKHTADVGVARKGTRLLELIQVEVRNAVHHVLERLSIEALRIKLAVCHSKIVLSY